MFHLQKFLFCFTIATFSVLLPPKSSKKQKQNMENIVVNRLKSSLWVSLAWPFCDFLKI